MIKQMTNMTDRAVFHRHWQ